MKIEVVVFLQTTKSPNITLSRSKAPALERIAIEVSLRKPWRDGEAELPNEVYLVIDVNPEIQSQHNQHNMISVETKSEKRRETQAYSSLLVNRFSLIDFLIPFLLFLQLPS